MQMFKRAVSVCVAMVLSACGPEAAEVEGVDARLATLPAALTSGISRGCTFSVSYTQRQGTLPPIYDIYLHRAARACPWGKASVLLASSSNYPPYLSLAANDLGVAVSYTYKATFSGSSPSFLGIQHVSPETMTTVRSTGLAPLFGRGFIYSGDLSIAADGTTLIVTGTKSGVIAGETGSGSNYTATYTDFFTSTNEPTIVAY
jgi:hypothetical protein